MVYVYVVTNTDTLLEENVDAEKEFVTDDKLLEVWQSSSDPGLPATVLMGMLWALKWRVIADRLISKRNFNHYILFAYSSYHWRPNG